MMPKKKTDEIAERLKSEGDIRLYLDAAFLSGDTAAIRIAVAAAARARARLAAPGPSEAPRRRGTRRSASKGSAPDKE
jgi:DNA-binding phage protein